MDCTVPGGPAVRQFCASMVCLSKIGKDLYFVFEPISGLAVRSLNDAKSGELRCRACAFAVCLFYDYVRPGDDAYCWRFAVPLGWMAGWLAAGPVRLNDRI